MTWLIIGGVIAALLAGGYFLAKRSGRLGAERDAAKKVAENAKDARKIEDDVRNLPDDALDRELRGD